MRVNSEGLNHDHGYVFVSETSGKPLYAQTISQEIYTLAKAASIEEKAHPTCSGIGLLPSCLLP